MNDLAIKIENISKKYMIGKKVQTNLKDSFRSFFERKIQPTPFWALRDITFDVGKGDAIGIIGRNGAGKSTLLKVLSRITEPTLGRFEITGRVSSLLEVGTGFHPELTGSENIYLNGTILGMTRSEVRSRYKEIVDFSGVEQFIDTPVKRYSSGMFVRLAFAIAAHLEPEILIIDEVLAVGDAEFQKKCLGKMGDVAQQGRTVLFVSHNMAAVQQLCPKSVLLQKGEVKAIGKTSDVMSTYLNYSGSAEQAILERIGDQSVVIDDFYITDQAGNRVSEFFMGDTFLLHLQLHFHRTLKNVDIGIAIKNIFDEKIAHLASNDDSLSISGVEGDIVNLTVKIPDFYLTSGLYKFDIGLDKFNDIYDCLFDCLTINLLQGDRIKRGYTIPQSVKVFLPSEWSIK